MNVLPVIERELRLQARRPGNHWLRVVSASAGMGALAVLLFDKGGATPQMGGRNFAMVHMVILGMFVLLVPAMTADCIAREKREGTLGLLRLTRLTAWDVALAKGLTQMVRALTILLAVIPMLAIPVLQGGVQGIDIASALVMELCAGLLALAAGIWASSLVEGAGAALFLAVLFSAGVAVGGAVFTLLSLILQAHPYIPDFQWRDMLDVPDLLEASLGLFVGWIDGEGPWSQVFSTLPRQVLQIWHWQLVESLLMSGLGFWLALRFAARSIERAGRGPLLTARQVWWRRAATTPLVFQSFFRRLMLRRLRRNPVVWLHVYDWRARVVKWGWCLGIIAAESLILVSQPTDDEFFWWQTLLAVVLGAGGLAVAAARSFHTEREASGFELLLVTPVTEGELVSGRLVVLYLDYAPALSAIVLCAVAAFIRPFSVAGRHWEILVVFLWVALNSFVMLPVIGLNYAVRLRRAFHAWLVICIWGFGYIWMQCIVGGAGVFIIFREAESDAPGRWPKIALVVAMIAVLQYCVFTRCWLALHRKLTRRIFAEGWG